MSTDDDFDTDGNEADDDLGSDVNQAITSDDENPDPPARNTNDLMIEAEQELSNRPREGVIYNEVTAIILARLRDLSVKEERYTIEEASEINDLAQCWKLLGRPKDDNLELSGQRAHEGALSLVQAEKLTERGNDLLDESKALLKLTDILRSEASSSN